MSRMRCPKFSDIELKVLVDGVVKEAPRLIGPEYMKTPLRQRNKLWKAILANVNNVATTPRRMGQIQKRWQDLRRRVRKLIADHYRESLAAGSGSPPSPLDLQPWEEQVMMVIDINSVEGIGELGGIETWAEGEQDSHEDDDGEDDGDNEDPMEGASELSPDFGEEKYTPPPRIITVGKPSLQKLRAGDSLKVEDMMEDAPTLMDLPLPPPGREFSAPPGPLRSVPRMAHAPTVSLSPPLPLAHAANADGVIAGVAERLSAMEAAQARMEKNGREMVDTCSLMVQVLGQVNRSLQGLQQEFSVANQLRKELVKEVRAAREEASAASAAAAAAAAAEAANVAAAAAEAYAGAREDARLARELASRHNQATCHAARVSSAAVRQMARSNVALCRQMVEASQRHAQSELTLTELLMPQAQSIPHMPEIVGRESATPFPSTNPFSIPSSEQPSSVHHPHHRHSHHRPLELPSTKIPEIKWSRREK
ncbi:myb-related transcription factor, partner of profilin-like [Ambystoma mexicanum]|uniref:myb-related transcription factor, partner of profilin-like n=1 Tax=Ambystoma mexicanum TaxID=8296 RepID=UPI0037E79E2F